MSNCSEHNRPIIATVDVAGEDVPLCCWLELTKTADPKALCADLGKKKGGRRGL